MDTIDIEGKSYPITGYANDGLPIIKATATSFQDGFDEEGNPKISVQINVPSAPLAAVPGQNG